MLRVSDAVNTCVNTASDATRNTSSKMDSTMKAMEDQDVLAFRVVARVTNSMLTTHPLGYYARQRW